jgi:hypothetical protein
MMERKETWDKTMLKLINQMKKRIVDLNNQYINKKQSVIGGNYKVGMFGFGIFCHPHN